MRAVVVMLGLAIGSAAASAADRELEVTMQTPASVQVTTWCMYGDKGCAQNAADVAQARCATFQRNAELAQSDLIERDLAGRQKFDVRFKCVK